MDTKNLVCVYLLLAVCLLLGSGCPCLCIPCKPESTFLKTNGKQIKDNYGTGTAVSLRGINLGGWLVQEPWMCNTGEGVVDEYTLRHTLAARFDQDKMWDLLNAYRDAYLQEADFRNIKDAGMNVVRIPINYMDYMDFDGTMRTSVPGQTSIWSRLDWAVEQAGKRGIYSIIDLHAAQGSQNGFDNSGQAGTAYFWYENTLGATCRANMRS